MNNLGFQQLLEAFRLLDQILESKKSESIHIIICGGAALIALELIKRVTKDVDILALSNDNISLQAPVPLPTSLLEASKEVEKLLKLPTDWLNNGPSSNEGGIFQMGLPEGLFSRVTTKKVGNILTVSFISRIDQIYFKLWASVDRGGYHIEDLLTLNPTNEELYNASLWTLEKDVSEGYRMILQKFLKAIGFDDVASKIT